MRGPTWLSVAVVLVIGLLLVAVGAGPSAQGIVPGPGAFRVPTYVTQTASPYLVNEQALSTLSTGIMRVATTTGVVTALTDSAGIAANVSDETGTGALVLDTAPTFTTSVTVQGANAQASVLTQATTSVTCNSAGATCVATNLIPAGSLVFGVTVRVTTTLSGALLTTWKAGDGTTANAFANAAALAATTTTSLPEHVSTWKPTLYTAATSVTLTANAGQFDAGVVRVTVHYLSLTAPGS